MAVSVYRLFAACLWKPAGSGFRSLERGAIAVHLQSDGIVRSLALRDCEVELAPNVAQLSIGAAVEPRQVAGKNVLHFASPIFRSMCGSRPPASVASCACDSQQRISRGSRLDTKQQTRC